MKSIYKSEEAKTKILALYDTQINGLHIKYKDIYLDTSFGRTHLIETGDPGAKPLLVFHGGNATTAYNLIFCRFLLDSFHIYAVDTIGHPGKSAETCLPAKGDAYGRWASEVITGLGYGKIACFGGSFGAGVLVKTMCAAPEKVERAALLVPSALKNAPVYRSMSMMLPMLCYWVTHKEKYFIKCILPMAISEENITKEILETARCSIDGAKIKTGMPSNAPTEELRRFINPVLVFAGEKDCLFPGEGVIRRAREVWPQCEARLLKGRGHIHFLTEEEKAQIKAFLLRT